MMPETPLDLKTSAAIVKQSTPGGQSWLNPGANVDENPDAPDIGGSPSPAPTGLAGPPGQPAKPPQGVGDRVASFISGGQASPGSVWRGILSGALTGMVAGAGQGHFGSGVAAGGAAEQKQHQQQFENKMQVTREGEEQKLRQAQIADLNHRLVSDTWDLSNRQALATEAHATAENNLKKFALDAPGSVDLGVVRDANDLVALHKARPELPSDLAKANIFSTPHFSPVLDGDGKLTGEQKYDGVSAMYVPPEYSKKILDHDVNVPAFTPGKKPNEPGTWGTQTLTAGTMSNGEALHLQSDRMALAAKYDNDALLAKAEAAKASAQLKLFEMEHGKPGYLSVDEVKAMGRALAADPVHLDLRTLVQLRGGDRTKVFLEAKAIDPNFNPMRATLALDTFKDFTTGDVAKNLSAFNPAIRHLALLGDAARAMNNGDAVALNRLANELGLQAGKTPIATYNAIHAAVSGEVGKVYKGAAPTDPEIELMDTAFNSAQSPGQAEAAISTTMRLMGEKVQDYYRRFKNGTGQTPEQNGIELVSKDVQEALKRHGLTSINKSGPPVNIPPGYAPVLVNGKTVGYADPKNPKGGMIPVQ
jgi:hypothetical protein